MSLTTAQSAVRMHIRNYLLVATRGELLAELSNRTGFEAECVRELLREHEEESGLVRTDGGVHEPARVRSFTEGYRIDADTVRFTYVTADGDPPDSVRVNGSLYRRRGFHPLSYDDARGLVWYSR